MWNEYISFLFFTGCTQLSYIIRLRKENINNYMKEGNIMFITLDDKMWYYSVYALGTVTIIEFNDVYYFSFMGIPALLMFCILFIGMVWFSKSWFYYLWGILTGIVIVVPMITQLLSHSDNILAVLVDGILSVVIFAYYGYKIYHKYKNDQC